MESAVAMFAARFTRWALGAGRWALGKHRVHAAIRHYGACLCLSACAVNVDQHDLVWECLFLFS
jgi:hypothetical protein